jgi:lysozyme family protein
MTTKNFPAALAATLVYEGGWSDHPKDPGGATMKGITLERYRAWERNPAVTKAQLRNISDEKVKAIYKAGYWDLVLGDELPGGLDFVMFDWAVNSGSARAVKALQRSLGIRVDGVMGPMALAAVRALNSNQVEDLIEDICNRRVAFIRSLSTYSTFGKGWELRIKSVRAKARGMMGGHIPVPTGLISGEWDEAPQKANSADTKAVVKPGVKPAVVASAAAIGTAATTAAQQLQGLSDTLEFIKWGVVGLTIIACLAGLYVSLKGHSDD